MSNLFTFEEARSLAERVVDVISPLVRKVKVAGSLRRNKDLVHDVDIVVIPLPLAFPNILVNELAQELGAKIIRSGPKILTVTVDGKQVDIYSASEQDWGIQLLRWTGSKDHNIKLCNRALSMGMRLAVSRGLEKDGKVIASRTEEEIFAALKMPYIPPEEREVP